MMRGRPIGSLIRANVIEILAVLKKGYGYQVAKIYNEVFNPVTQRSIYYHLRKGVKTKELDIEEIKTEKGDFSWGGSVEKTYYILGREARPKGNERLEVFIREWIKKEVYHKKVAEKVAEIITESVPVPSPSVFTRIARKFRKEK